MRQHENLEISEVFWTVFIPPNFEKFWNLIEALRRNLNLLNLLEFLGASTKEESL
jgi:hypothetical protein